MTHLVLLSSFFFNNNDSTQISTLSLHDALPISEVAAIFQRATETQQTGEPNSLPSGGGMTLAQLQDIGREVGISAEQDRKSTRLNSSHSSISYAVFCLKKKSRSKRCSESL